MFKKTLKLKINLENMVETMPIDKIFFEIFVLGNLLLGITSGILIRFFYLALKFTDFKYLTLFYSIRIFMYSWLVFYGGFSLILILKRHAELKNWQKNTVFAYIAISCASLYLFESFMPFQVIGSEIYHKIYHSLIS